MGNEGLWAHARNRHGFHGNVLWKRRGRIKWHPLGLIWGRENKGHHFEVTAYGPVDEKEYANHHEFLTESGSIIMRKITIELKVDFPEDSENLKLAIDTAKEKAKELYASMLLIAGRRQPQIVVRSGDYFSSVEDVSLEETEAS